MNFFFRLKKYPLPPNPFKREVYRPTFNFKGNFINKNHLFYATCKQKDGLLDIGIEGWLWKEDALKLYEMAFFSRGDILELGSYKGLSTSILGQGVSDSGALRNILSVDFDPGALNEAKKTLNSLKYGKNIQFFCSDAGSFCHKLSFENRRFGLIFVDHDHSFSGVNQILDDLASLIIPGGFCLFHDYSDIRNLDPTIPDYGVFQAVEKGFNKKIFNFFGISGVTGIFRAKKNLVQYLKNFIYPPVI